jgi:hypothetical protein
VIVLSPTRERELVAALLDGFERESLERSVMEPLRVPVAARSEARSAEVRVQKLVEWAKQESRLEDLLRLARRANPKSLKLQVLAEVTGLLPATSNIVESLRDVLPQGATEWLRGLAEVRRQVCRIAIGSTSGTGFLVGPDQVMTHPLLFGGSTGDLTREPASVSFEDEPAGYRSDAIIFESERAVIFGIDRVVDNQQQQQQQMLVGSTRARGWIVGVRGSAPKPAVVIVQLTAEHLAVTADVEGLVSASADQLRYRTSTALGSLGAPCFDTSWRLIGIHTSHDAAKQWNEGVSIEAVLRDLESAGFTWSTSSGIESSKTGDEPPVRTTFDDILQSIDVSAVRDPDADAWDIEVEDVTPDDCWAWAEAAAVVASFDPETLHPMGAPVPAARIVVLLECQQVRRPDGVRWMLPDRIRKRALARLAERNQLREAREVNMVSAWNDPLDDLLQRAILTSPPSIAELREPERLRAMLQVVDWLEGVVSGLPARDELRAALERATLIAPFRHLTRGFFAGRDTELSRLAVYVDRPDEEAAVPPLFVHGPGGMGKSALLAHFILRHSERDPANPAAWRPFVYLDFDRPDIDGDDLVRVMLAIARQLGPQVPSVLPQVDEVVTRWSTRRRTANRPRRKAARKRIQTQLAPRMDPDDVMRLVTDVAELFGAVHDVLPSPVLLVLDTLEEVQYAHPDGVGKLVELVHELQDAAPMLRPVLAGRIEFDESLEVEPLKLEPLPPLAAEALLGNHLPAELANNSVLIARMAKIVGGNPLSLRLAAEVLRKEKDPGALLASLDDELWKRVGDAIVQGRLYERILGHIHDDDIKAMAYPGLVLRTVTWELIRDVLAGPCGLDVPDENVARDLFLRLALEVALVRQGNEPDTLELRPELRRIVLDDLTLDPASKDKQRRIRELAVAYYTKRSTLPDRDPIADRAEELYHRFWLDHAPDSIDERWLRGVENALRSALDERLPDRARSYLANRVGVVQDAKLMKKAPQQEWEVWAEKRAGDLLRFGSAARALEILAMRDARLPTSKLHLIESVAMRSLPEPDLAVASAAAERAVTAARASGDASDLRDALEELVQVSRLRDDTAALMRALAELGNLGDVLGDDLVVLQAAVEGLEAIGPTEAVLSESAIRVFGRLPDEIVARAPELARRVAAQVGEKDPSTLQRVIRLVGTGAVSPDAAAGLARVLDGWKQRSPDIAPFIPNQPGSTRELADAAKYLLESRRLDRQTAASFTAWLRTVVTPPKLVPAPKPASKRPKSPSASKPPKTSAKSKAKPAKRTSRKSSPAAKTRSATLKPRRANKRTAKPRTARSSKRR